jgi:predicted kinase
VLVVLRGNSGSGKSTVAALLQQRLGWPTAVLQQDHFSRVVYEEPDQARMAHADLLELAAVQCLRWGQHVVLDGIFSAPRYAPMLQRVAQEADDARFFAFDLPFDETVRRHAMRPKSGDFDVEEMRTWYHGWQPLPFVQEHRIGPEESASQVVDRVVGVGGA